MYGYFTFKNRMIEFYYYSSSNQFELTLPDKSVKLFDRFADLLVVANQVYRNY